MENSVEATLSWKRVQLALQAQLLIGTWQVGDRLPGEQELAKQFVVSRATIRKALGNLQLQGLIRTEQGRGSYVNDHAFAYTLDRASRFCHYLDTIGVSQARATISNRVVLGEERLTTQLQLPPASRLAVIEVQNFANDAPVFVATNYLSANRFPGIGDAYERYRSLTAALRRYDVLTTTRAHTELISRLPSRREANLLRQPKDRPVTEVENLLVDQNDNPTWLEALCFASDRVRFVLAR